MQKPAHRDVDGTSARRHHRFVLATLLVMLTLACFTVSITAQPPAGDAAADAKKDADGKEAEEEEVPLLEREPFDVVTLDEANKNARLEVYPLPFPGRRKPTNPSPSSKLEVQLLADDKKYEVYWRNVRRVDLYEELLLREAERLRDAKPPKFDEAFDYYFHLNAVYPRVSGLQPSFQRYLFLDAGTLYRSRRYAEALAILEELYARNKNYRFSAGSPPLMTVIGGLLDRILDEYIKKQDYGSARKILRRVAVTYGDARPSSLSRWAQQLAQLAEKKRDEARTHLDAKEFHEAINASKEMINIWPEVAGAEELDALISNQFPMVTVGVTQPAMSHDSRRMDNWGSRRTGRLIHRTLVEFLGAGAEGGEYDLTLGDMQRSPDQKRLTLRLKQFSEEDDSVITGYDITRRLLSMANPLSEDYMPAWGGVMQGAFVKDVTQVEIDLRQPHVLPEALLRVPIEPPSDQAEDQVGNGPFEVSDRAERMIYYSVKGFTPGARLAEIVERNFDDTQQAMAALRRGDIDVVDRLFPADAARLGDELSFDDPIVIEQYALPTIHMLLINADNPFLKNPAFRRSIAFAIDRERILKEELLGGREIPGCQVISGPFAAGVGDRDPLAYAYDVTVKPRGYFPRLARLLTIVSTQQVEQMAEKRGDPKPELSKLVLGHPSYESARLACEAIAAHLKLINLEIELKEFPPGESRDPEGKVDLTYAEIAIWEPLVDARRLMGEGGLAYIDNPYINRALRQLDAAQTWGEVRDRLLDLHRTAHNEVAVVPLWQMADSFAYRKRLRNVIGDSPLVWLYQNVDQWRLSPTGVAE